MSRTILVIEDEAGIRDNLREMLEAEGYLVHEAVDGMDGIRKVEEINPDLVVCDVMMPGKDGYAVLEALRESEKTIEVPFLFLTARADRESHRRGMELGAEDYLTKPFSRSEVLSAVEARLRRAESVGKKLRDQIAGMRQLLARSLPHEILTPLNGILGLSAMLVEEYESMRRGEIMELAKGISASGENLHRLVRRFLVYSEMQLALADADQTARLRMERVENPPENLERNARDLLQSTPRIADLHCSFQPGAAHIASAHLELCVQEMLLEGMRRGGPGRPLRLRCGPVREGWSLGMHAEGVHVDPDELERLRNGGAAGDGMGLGLATLRTAAVLYGGGFSVDCSRMNGFSLELVLGRPA